MPQPEQTSPAARPCWGRAVYRVTRVGLTLLGAFLAMVWRGWQRRPITLPERAEWCARTSRRLLRVLGLKVTVMGNLPARGCLVTNHLSYLDIMVLASVRPVVFVSKAEVRRWPGIGYLVGLAGTLFIRRQSRLQVSAAVTRMQEALDQGVVLAFFPEGTTTGGDQVLLFRASLLEAAVTGQQPVTPGCLRYELPGGSVPDEVCYWRDMTFFSHLANLCRHREIRAHVTYGEPMAASQDRKQLAHALRQEVLRLGGFPPDAGGAAENF